LVGKGDYVDCEGEVGLEQTNEWLEFLAMLDENLNQNGDNYKYIPLAFVIGNHETTPSYGAEPENASYLRFFFKYPKKLEPVGMNYGSVKIGDYLQLLMLDTGHTAEPGGEQKDWLKNVIDQSIKHVVPVMHLSPFPSYRDPNAVMQDRVRQAWMEIFYDAANIKVAFDGHDHSWKRTVPLGVVESKPDHGNNEEKMGFFIANGKYITETKDGVIFFGDGSWGSNSTSIWNPATTWYLDDAQARLSNYKRGYSGVVNKNDHTQAGKHLEHVYIVSFETDRIIVKSVSPSGEVFHKKEIY